MRSPLKNAQTVELRQFPGWWWPGGAGRIMHPERTWKFHGAPFPYFALHLAVHCVLYKILCHIPKTSVNVSVSFVSHSTKCFVSNWWLVGTKSNINWFRLELQPEPIYSWLAKSRVDSLRLKVVLRSWGQSCETESLTCESCTKSRQIVSELSLMIGHTISDHWELKDCLV